MDAYRKRPSNLVRHAARVSNATVVGTTSLAVPSRLSHTRHTVTNLGQANGRTKPFKRWELGLRTTATIDQRKRARRQTRTHHHRGCCSHDDGVTTHLYSVRPRLHSETATLSLDNIHRSLGAADSRACRNQRKILLLLLLHVCIRIRSCFYIKKIKK